MTELRFNEGDNSEDGDGARGQHSAIAPLLIHIGFHKTGSTWLQKSFLNDPSRGFSHAHAEGKRSDIARLLAVPDPLCFDAREARAHFRDYVDAIRANEVTPVISHEILSGYPSSGGRDRCMIADRLRATFPEARVLMVIREQRAMIRSMYGQHVKAGGAESLRRYLTKPKTARGLRPLLTLQYFEYDRLILYYQALFGPDRVLALPLELLARQPQDFADRIAAFCGHAPAPVKDTRPRNTRDPLPIYYFMRFINFLFYHNELSPGALVDLPSLHFGMKRLSAGFRAFSPKWLDEIIERRQRREIELRVGNHFIESNMRTAQLMGLPLAEYGYTVAPT
jgi:hypothetical protein